METQCHQVRHPPISGTTIPSPIFGKSDAESLAKEFVSIAAPSTEDEDGASAYDASAELYSDQTTEHLVVTSNDTEHPKTASKLFPEDTTLSKEMFPEDNSTLTDESSVIDNKKTVASNEVNISMNEGNTLDQTGQGDSDNDGESHAESEINEGDNNSDGDNNNNDGESHAEPDSDCDGESHAESERNEGDNNSNG